MCISSSSSYQPGSKSLKLALTVIYSGLELSLPKSSGCASSTLIIIESELASKIVLEKSSILSMSVSSSSSSSVIETVRRSARLWLRLGFLLHSSLSPYSLLDLFVPPLFLPPCPFLSPLLASESSFFLSSVEVDASSYSNFSMQAARFVSASAVATSAIDF